MQGRYVRPIASVVLKGKTAAMNVFEPLHDDDFPPPYLARYQTAYEAVRDGRPEARALFEALVSSSPAIARSVLS